MGNRYINDIFLKAVFYRVNHCGITKDTISHARSRQGLRPVGARACRPIVNAYKLYILVSRANFDEANMIFYIVNLHRHTFFQTRYSFNAFHIFISRIIDIYIFKNISSKYYNNQIVCMLNDARVFRASSISCSQVFFP